MTAALAADLGLADTFDPALVAWVFSIDDLLNLGQAIRTAIEIVPDLETTGLDEHAYTNGPWNGGVGARVVCASFTIAQADDVGDPITWVLPLSHPESPWIGKWRTVLAKVFQLVVDLDKPVNNQNVKFDARWIYATTRKHVDISGCIAWDTRISSHLLDENASTKLKERAPDTFGIRRWDDFDLTTPGAAERVPLIDLGLYAARDTYWTWKLGKLHRQMMFLEPGPDGERLEPLDAEEIEHARLGKLAVWVAMPTTATLTAIEQRGMLLDKKWVADRIAENSAELTILHADLSTRYEFSHGLKAEDASFAPTALWFLAWAQAAVDVGDLRIAGLTPQGRPTWGKAVLIRQARAGSDVAQNLLDYRQRSKRLEFLNSWLGHAKRDGRIHASYNAGSVVTGRLSSSDPNMQQVTAALKAAFIPSPGYVIADFDYSQIELRVAAFVSRCVPMIAAYLRGDDLHKLMAARITGKPVSEILPAERQAGKSANFGLLYGMSPMGFLEYAETVYGVTFTPEEAVAVHAAFFQLWEGLGAWHAKAISRAHRTGQVVSPIGRIRRLPMIYDRNDKVVGYAERAAINAPVQGFASDLMQTAAASIEGKLPGFKPVPGVRLVGTVHDSIVAELPEDTWEESARACIDRMINIPEVLRKLDCNFDIPLGAEAKIGTRWGLKDVGLIEV